MRGEGEQADHVSDGLKTRSRGGAAGAGAFPCDSGGATVSSAPRADYETDDAEVHT
jgi:hypothetical protein